MSFAPPGVSIAKAFVKQDGGSKSYQQKIDRLCTITSWADVARGVVHVTEDGTNNVIEARVAADDIARNVESARKNPNPVPQRWAGYAIDQRMEKELPVGTKIVLERCNTIKKFPEGGVDKRIVECSRVIHVTDPSPSKIFKGLFTISGYKGQIRNVQHWNDMAISVDDLSALEEIANELDKTCAAYENKENRPGLGVQFRTIVPHDLEPGKPESERVWSVIDTSPQFDWTAAVRDEAQNVIEPGHPISGDTFAQLANDYQDYILGVAAHDGQAAAPGRFDAETAAKVKVEVLTYTSFLASNMSQYMQIPEQEFSPIYQMANTPIKWGQEDEEPRTGKNWGVFGILQLSSDKADAVNKTWITRDLATRLFANGFRGNLQNCVKTSTGNKAKAIPELDRPKLEQPANAARRGAAPSSAPSSTMAPPVAPPVAAPVAANTPITAPVAAPVSAGVFGDGDPFLAAMEVSAQQTAAPVSSAAVETTTAVDGAASQEVPAAGGRFGGRR